ncbi:Oxidoreductase family, NAD-binding Rossmann fold [Poseidonocella pacifica]|uniref:Oxidoreductase family, NAD-binding Rossmann fold n=1 Tax=Poseidonocella pacifica TaxID=871651 RepID=A0A1I0VVG6_9RHOB|nr:Gfo/Idh/MocA family oxidoreductase [Poseidonocella pacifica]SFA80415.1 Oxidoreductase family, NAD-binding Rossmann fold [Poseidonocella pacifica]
MDIGLGLIGTGFMGKAHGLAYHAAGPVFGDLSKVGLACLCDTPPDMALAMDEQFGFAGPTDDWRALNDRLDIDIAVIASSNAPHHPIALASIVAGKHVHS